MRRILLLIVTIILYSTHLSAQKKIDFELIVPESEIENSHYNSFDYLDMRSDKESLGYTYSEGKGKLTIINKTPLRKQFSALMEYAIKQPIDNRTLFVQLRKFEFSEGEKDYKGWSVCRFRATFYEQDADNYYFISTIDTLVVSSQKRILADMSAAINSAFTQNLQILPLEDEVPYSLAEVKDVDHLERNNIPLFTNASLPDGIYFDYKTLALLAPSITDFRVSMDKNGLKNVEIKDADKPGKEKKLKAKDVYAVVAEGDLYIAYDNKFCRAFAEDGNLKFISVQNLNSGLISGVSFATGSGGGYGGAIGFNLGPKPKIYVKMTFDQLDGQFIFEGYVE